MPPQMPQQPYGPPRKKSSALFWVLTILGGLFLLLVLAIGGGVFYLKHKLNAAGVDTELMKRNPTLAAARIAAALNPNIEVVSVNEGRGVLTVREKSTGKVYSVNFEDAKNGKWTMTEDGKKVEVSSSGGPNGSVEMKGPDGSVTFGGTATNIPSWVPQYPGSKPENAITSNQPNETGGMYHFKTKDSAEQVIKFYGDQVKSAGLKITNTTTSSGLGDVSAILTAQDDDKNRTVNIAVTTEEGQNGVTVTYASKK